MSRNKKIRLVREEGQALTGARIVLQHEVGDRVTYYQDSAMTGTVIDAAGKNRVYAVNWDHDEPTKFSGWYTYSMLTPMEESR